MCQFQKGHSQIQNGHPDQQERNVNTVKGSASGTIPPLRGFTFIHEIEIRRFWGCAEYGVGRRDRGRSQHQALRWQTKKGPDRGGSVEGVGSGPASHQKKHQVNAAWCIWFQSSKKITSRHSVPCNQQPSLTVCDRRVRYSYMSVPLGPSPMRNFGGGYISHETGTTPNGGVEACNRSLELRG
jgi:hypothetical protein